MKLMHGLKKVFKSYMMAGIAVLIPLIGTYLILQFIIDSIDSMAMSLIPSRFHPEKIFGQDIPGLGLITTILLILLVGILTRLYIGRKMVQMGDRMISKIPLGRGIYNGIKQFMSNVLTSNREKFRSVVAVEYPRRGCWVLGFVTGDAISELQGIDDKAFMNVFVPTTPNPTSGFLIMVPKGEIKILSIGIDEAFKLIISGGILQAPQMPAEMRRET